MAIPEQHQNQLVDASLHFMRALANVYGSDRALEFWTTLSDTVDTDLKGLTFAAMLTGRTGELLVINSLPTYVNKIALIKAIRTWDRRLLGLKEAKDLVDNLNERGKAIELEINYEKIALARQEFINLGCRGIGL